MRARTAWRNSKRTACASPDETKGATLMFVASARASHYRKAFGMVGSTAVIATRLACDYSEERKSVDAEAQPTRSQWKKCLRMHDVNIFAGTVPLEWRKIEVRLMARKERVR